MVNHNTQYYDTVRARGSIGLSELLYSPTNNFAENFYFVFQLIKLHKRLLGLIEIKTFPAISEA